MPRSLSSGPLSPTRRRHRHRLELEPLEERSLPSAASFVQAPIVPDIDAGMQAYLQAVLAYGASLGNQPNVFIKVGDSISFASAFLTPLGQPDYDPTNPALVGSHTDLAPVVAFFGAQAVDDAGDNSFTRTSLATFGGWRSDDVLNPVYDGLLPWSLYAFQGETPLDTEIRLTQPAFALIMLGTNDLLQAGDPEQFRANLTAVADTALSQGVIPVLSTIPDVMLAPQTAAPQVAVYNQVVADVAASLDIPLWNYWRALQLLPNHGIGPGGIHPSLDPAGTGVFTDAGLEYGYNLRNLTALEVLAKLQSVVLDGGAADPPGGAPVPAAVATYLDGVYLSVLGRPLDPLGLAAWGEDLRDGVPASSVVSAIWAAPEHRLLEIDQYYRTFLGRAPDALGLAGWLAAFESGMGETAVEVGILTSAEFQQDHPGNASFVTALYPAVLGRSPDAAGEAGWLGLLSQGASRQVVAYAMLTSAEAERRLLDSYYADYLGRTASPAEEEGWLALLQEGLVSPGEAAVDFLTSPEFWLRWGSTP